ncbi:uncharacterized protein MONOS_11845 [Monocercomonoides exilis]|uniref:uncharacterized protein n=1 Tax=Monocercomonoides exilis TaxID=2049356 RepID=UPI003559B3F1|nr:hypothetical protein MONOS_11845 [Monocercomonoides exilis]|eukprot:MONOS_11845.1-p1 / transcript=MONOS_11845.1 / gene=MONOS_11845 / organism=Monocercomonoides_exilis_PA203 / gene_product=unspecified product / transcript_product=unspecified product / location=Mono_scaffold00617:34394-34675(+) / protein_length=94 / sequence_SO=supercontig / SO=protein_coding / is_pseudo=false
MFFGEFEGLQSEKGEADVSVFLGILLNNYLAEAVKRKNAIRALYDAICSCNPSTPSTSSSTSSSSPGAVRRGIKYSELESLQCVCHPQTPQSL